MTLPSRCPGVTLRPSPFIGLSIPRAQPFLEYLVVVLFGHQVDVAYLGAVSGLGEDLGLAVVVEVVDVEQAKREGKRGLGP